MMFTLLRRIWPIFFCHATLRLLVISFACFISDTIFTISAATSLHAAALRHTRCLRHSHAGCHDIFTPAAMILLRHCRYDIIRLRLSWLVTYCRRHYADNDDFSAFVVDISPAHIFSFHHFITWFRMPLFIFRLFIIFSLITIHYHCPRRLRRFLRAWFCRRFRRHFILIIISSDAAAFTCYAGIDTFLYCRHFR